MFSQLVKAFRQSFPIPVGPDFPAAIAGRGLATAESTTTVHRDRHTPPATILPFFATTAVG